MAFIGIILCLVLVVIAFALIRIAISITSLNNNVVWIIKELFDEDFSDSDINIKT